MTTAARLADREPADALERGQGVALGILPFINEDIREGRLLRPFELTIDPGLAYYLIDPKSRRAKPSVRAVRDWLLEGAGDSNG